MLFRSVKSVFSLVGDNIEWAAPEVMAQVFNQCLTPIEFKLQCERRYLFHWYFDVGTHVQPDPF